MIRRALSASFLLTALMSLPGTTRAQQSQAILLSGGGARGDFEVGALKLLYDQGVRPSILCGTSVGSLNASKLAEGDAAITELEQIWRAISGNNAIYEPSAAFRELMEKEPALAKELLDAVAGVGLGIPPVTALALSKLLHDAVPTVNDLQLESGMFDFNPLRDTIIVPKLHPEKVRSSGIRLCVAAVSLEDGDAVHISETGTMTGKGYRISETGDMKLFVRTPTQVDMVKAILASSSIPILFEPVQMGQDGEHFIDGGVREVLPVDAFLEAAGGAGNVQPKVTNIYAILASPIGLHPWNMQFNASLNDLSGANFPDKIQLLRVVKQTLLIMADQIYQDNAARLQVYADSVGAKLTVISPLDDVHDALTFDPELIVINMDYGYDRAGDVVLGASESVSSITRQLLDTDLDFLTLEQDSAEPSPGHPSRRLTFGGLIECAHTLWQNPSSVNPGGFCKAALQDVSQVSSLVYSRTTAGFPTASLAWEHIKRFDDWPYAHPGPSIKLQPAKFDWGSVADQPAVVDRRALTIGNAGTAALTARIRLVGKTDPFGVADSGGGNLNNQQISVNPNSSIGLFVTLDNSKPLGDYVASITLQTNDPANSVVEIPLHVNLIPSLPEIQWQPSGFDWGNKYFDSGSDVRMLTIGNIGAKLLSVSVSLVGKTDPFGVADSGGRNLNNQQISVNPNGQTTIKVTVDYSSSIGDYVGSIQLQTNDPANSIVLIPLHVHILARRQPLS